MFTEKKLRLVAKLLTVTPETDAGLVLFSLPQQPHGQGLLVLPVETVLSKSLAGFFVAFFYCVNKGIRRNVGF